MVNQAVLRLHVDGDISKPIRVLTEISCNERQGPDGVDLVDLHRQAAIAVVDSARQFHGSGSSSRWAGCSATGGAVKVDGAMVDPPVIKRAEQIMRRADAGAK